MFPEAIAAVLKKPGEDVIVDDPRGDGSRAGPQARQAHEGAGRPEAGPEAGRSAAARRSELLAVLRNADDWDKVADT